MKHRIVACAAARVASTLAGCKAAAPRDTSARINPSALKWVYVRPCSDARLIPTSHPKRALPGARLTSNLAPALDGGTR